MRHQCENLRGARVRAFGDHRQNHPGLGLPALHVRGGRDRRELLLGWRLHGQPAHPAAHRPYGRDGRYPAHPDQPEEYQNGAHEHRGHQGPGERAGLQLLADAGAQAHQIQAGAGGAGHYPRREIKAGVPAQHQRR